MIEPSTLTSTERLTRLGYETAPDPGSLEARLCELEELKTTFVTLVSHELRTPSTVLVGYLQTAIDELGSEVPSTSRRHFEVALQQAKNLSRVIQELTDFARLQHSRPVELVTPIPVGEALVQVFTMLRPALESKAIKPSLELPPEVWKHTYDGESMVIIFRNLLSNCAKYTPVAGRVWVTGYRLPGRAGVVVCVNDTAPPIPREQHSAIFEDFRQLENFLTRRYEGMGLGLAVARRTARTLNGEITIAARPDGNSFLVTLPS